MNKTKPALASALLLLGLSGCVAEGYAPAPYYGGVAPYYGTTYAPTYVGVYGGGYYQHYSYHNIHSGYNNGYWHYQHQMHAAPAAGVAHGGGGRPAGGHGGDGHH